MTKQEAAKLAGQTYFIYTLREIKSGTVIYVGRTRYMGRRLTEHRGSLADPENHAGIYEYMREHDLQFFVDVEVCIVDYKQKREEATQRETELIQLYKDTVKNTVLVDTRKYNTDPRFRKVRCITTGEEFWAVNPVLEKFGMSRYLLVKAIENKTEICGHKFEWIE